MSSWSSGGSSEQYHYHPSGWRVWKKPASGDGVMYLHGPSGQPLYEQKTTTWAGAIDYIYYAGRLLYKVQCADNGQWVWTRTPVYTDRLGSRRGDRARGTASSLTRMNYCPFGEEIGTVSPNNAFKFASTYRDAVWDGSQYVATGLDYAVNRYYASGMGRFLSADPYQASGGPGNPQSWNRYAYALNDPVNLLDPSGLIAIATYLSGVAGTYYMQGSDYAVTMGYQALPGGVILNTFTDNTQTTIDEYTITPAAVMVTAGIDSGGRQTYVGDYTVSTAYVTGDNPGGVATRTAGKTFAPATMDPGTTAISNTSGTWAWTSAAGGDPIEGKFWFSARFTVNDDGRASLDQIYLEYNWDPMLKAETMTTSIVHREWDSSQTYQSFINLSYVQTLDSNSPNGYGERRNVSYGVFCRCNECQ
jgi:RHS repeat-associated protein